MIVLICMIYEQFYLFKSSQYFNELPVIITQLIIKNYLSSFTLPLIYTYAVV